MLFTEFIKDKCCRRGELVFVLIEFSDIAAKVDTIDRDGGYSGDWTRS